LITSDKNLRHQQNLSSRRIAIVELPTNRLRSLANYALQLGSRVIWLHTYGERFSAPKAGRPKGPPRLPKDHSPRIPAKGAIPDSLDAMPETIEYDLAQQRLLIGGGYVERVNGSGLAPRSFREASAAAMVQLPP
jgi:hypothetical protein